MRQLLMVVVMLSSWTACTMDADQADPTTAVHEQAISQIIGEKFDNLIPGSINGQDGWEGNCVVSNEHPPGNHLKCVGNRWARKSVGLHSSGNYTLLVDLGPNSNVVNSTHGKITYEGPEGRAFQIILGCDNVRFASRLGPEQAGLLTFPCGSVAGPPAFRVVCNWTIGGTVLSCGGSRLPADPVRFVNLAVPPIRSFDRVEVSTFDLPGASLFDKVYIWQN